jgi:uncharacterized membrane protein
MDVYLIVLRVLHIAAGVFWVGAAALFFFFVEPTVKALGPTGGAFMGHLAQKKKMPAVILASAGLTVLAGILLYLRSSGGFDLDWITSSTGLTFTIGGLAGIAAFLIGLTVVKPAVDLLGALGGEVQASGGQPNEAQAAQLQAVDRKLTTVGRLNMGLLTLAVLAMATARYL